MNYKKLLFSLIFVLSLGQIQSATAMDIQAVNAGANQLMLEACKRRIFDHVKVLIEHAGADVNAQEEGQQTALHHASFHRFLKLVTYLVDKGANINLPDGAETGSPLHTAAMAADNSQVITYLIEKGARVNSRDSNQNIPLHSACTAGQLRNVIVLLNNGADVLAQDTSNWQALHHACHRGDLEIVKLLVEKGADVDGKTDLQWSPLFLACQKGYTSIMRYLIGKGANVYTPSDTQLTLLHIAAANNQADTVQYLIKSYPDLIDLQDIDGFTALDTALDLRKNEAVKVFAKNGIRVVSEKQAEENMRAFFAELNGEAQQVQAKRVQQVQKKQQNTQGKKQVNQNNKKPANQNNGNAKKINNNQNAKVTNNSTQQAVDLHVPLNVPIESKEVAKIAVEKAIVISNEISTKSGSSKSSSSESIEKDKSVNISVKSAEKQIIITPKKEQNVIQITDVKPQQAQPVQIANQYQVGSGAKLKWPRSLTGSKYNNMRDHLNRLKKWPNTQDLDIKQLKGQVGMYRLRVGGYRVLFSVDQELRRIIISEIGLRKNVYKGL